MECIKHIVIFGGSNTTGAAFSLGKTDPAIYPNIVANTLKCKLDNHGQGGASNYEIFLKVIDFLTQNNTTADYLMVEWVPMNRFNFNPEFKNGQVLHISPEDSQLFKDKEKLFSNKEYKLFIKMLFTLTTDYKLLCDLLLYVRTINNLCVMKNIKPIFINGDIDWTEGIFDYRPHSDLYKLLSDRNRYLLNFSQLDDTTVIEHLVRLKELFNHTDHKNNWVNLYEKFGDFRIDYSSDNTHYGEKTHKLIATKILNFITERYQ